MATFPEISTWLTIDLQRSKDGKYEHVLGREDGNDRTEIIPILKAVIAAAHEDACNKLRALAGPSLDPLGTTDARDPAEGYPHTLHMQSLKGYFGEVMAGLVAENLGAFGHDDWEVPAYLFRFHLVEFQQLDFMDQTDDEADLRPGRTGDDCLAFRRDADGNIVAALLCEAKCTKGHKSALIDDAHEKSSLPNLLPVDLLRLIEILSDAKGKAAKRWVRALRKLYHSGPNPGGGYERLDQVTYVCGNRPKAKEQDRWIPADKPHAKYTAGRRLQVAEIQLNDVEGLIEEAYGVA
jgi:hypothetical protein